MPTKMPLLIVSPDQHPLRETVLRKISEALPELTITIIQNLPYRKYRELVQRAKWSLTFGEGLDGYFAEQVFSGGIGFAVFNPRFFTPEFSTLENVYPSWEALIQQIVSDIHRLDEPVAYHKCWSRSNELLMNLYDTERTRENLRQFYRGNYTFP